MKIKDYMPSIYVKRCLWRRVILACMLVSIIDPLCWAELKDSDLRFKGKVLEPVPWRANKKLFDQLKQERKVYIEVKSGEFESGADQLKTLNIHGAIVITENAKKAYTEVCKFNFLNGLSSFIKEVVWVPQKKHL
ncbi:MAG: hypothetical protein KDD50_14285, partial [Bdellovibrionales bacterium]|nr:hypothetical protein [Bdellovibrionales bacterium]